MPTRIQYFFLPRSTTEKTAFQLGGMADLGSPAARLAEGEHFEVDFVGDDVGLVLFQHFPQSENPGSVALAVDAVVFSAVA